MNNPFSLTQRDYQQALGSEVHDPAYLRFLTRVSLGGDDQVLHYCREAPQDQQGNSGQEARGANRGLLMLSSDPSFLQRRQAELATGGRCGRCGAARVFECQVMPQLLHYLQVDRLTQLASKDEARIGADAAELSTEKQVFVNKSAQDIDWGSLNIFTCSASCDLTTATTVGEQEAIAIAAGTLYEEERVLIQPLAHSNPQLFPSPPPAAAVAAAALHFSPAVDQTE
ncbi:hypothetical protein B484DRAFT_407020 [Ochromonadaceae sp. CCMP2298]|nr:hypothetical protein B484DRAFT_407020 [Ochromonadaceae sp. CCMP2298]